MKIIALAACLLIVVSACKTSKKTTETVAKNETSAAAVVAPALSPDLEAASEKRYPGIAKAEIAEGEKLYNGKCGKCHGLPEVESVKEEKWPGIMDWMAPKARMDDVQKEKVLKYVLCAYDVKTKK